MSTEEVECFVLLDDCTANASDPRSRLYTRCVGALLCDSAQTLTSVLQQLEQSLSQGQHAVGLFSYELGAQLHDVAHTPSDWPLAQILLFDRCERLSDVAVERWLGEKDTVGNAPSGLANLHASVDEAAFDNAIQKIHHYIEAGDTYQVNYTYRLRGDVYGSPIALYRRLRERQPVPYGALVVLPDGRSVLSFSPELFLRHENGRLMAQPMKGTAPASGEAKVDAHRAQALSQDEKNRAENLMIVDLLRNDLGRIAQPGSVQVPALYEVNAFGSVLQMT